MVNRGHHADAHRFQTRLKQSPQLQIRLSLLLKKNKTPVHILQPLHLFGITVGQTVLHGASLTR